MCFLLGFLISIISYFLLIKTIKSSRPGIFCASPASTNGKRWGDKQTVGGKIKSAD